MDQIGAVLKRAMPFQTARPQMLREIEKLARCDRMRAAT